MHCCLANEHAGNAAQAEEISRSSCGSVCSHAGDKRSRADSFRNEKTSVMHWAHALSSKHVYSRRWHLSKRGLQLELACAVSALLTAVLLRHAVKRCAAKKNAVSFSL